MSLKDELLNPAVDWQKVKEILLGIEKAFDDISKMLPEGMLKNILLGLMALISLIIQMLPSDSSHG